jgi:hypothetical protein
VWRAARTADGAPGNQQAVCPAPASRRTRCPCALQSSVRPEAWRAGYNTNSEEMATFLPLSTPGQTDVEPWMAGKCTAQRTVDFPPHNTGFKRFPFDNFTYCLTLFSKFFSSFPHGTCSLSVSRQYLALDGIYHPFWSAFPNKPTLGKRITWEQAPDHTRDSHPL